MMNAALRLVIPRKGDLLQSVTATIEPEPPDEELREAILAALADPDPAADGWSAAALLDGVEEGEPDP